MRQFQVVCYKHDVGMFTGYGIKINTRNTTDARLHPHHEPCGHWSVQCEPGFTNKILYEVTVFTNPELSQSIVIYADKNLEVAKLVLNNFMTMVLRGADFINISKINDKTPMTLDIKCDEFGCPEHYKHWYWNPWDMKYPKKNPYMDIYDYSSSKPESGEFLPKPPVNGNFDGDEIRFAPDGSIINNPPMPPIDDWSRASCTPEKPEFPPHHPHPPFPPKPPFEREIEHLLRKILWEVTPDEKKPEHRKKIVCYFGDGGIAMGGSVRNYAKLELSPNALREMLAKNGKSTFSTSTDKIDVKSTARQTIVDTDEFKVMNATDDDTHWGFFMIPDRFAKLVQNFNWYYQDELVDNTWTENIAGEGFQVENFFTYQTNGIRYYCSAIKIDGKYNVKFALSSMVNDTTTDDDTTDTTDDTNTDDPNKDGLSG